jgi:hypothetical protein
VLRLPPEALRSLALHQAVVEAWPAHPEWRSFACARIERWYAQGTLDAEYAGRWRSWLQLPDSELLVNIVAISEEAIDMRQTSPLTCGLHPKQRWRILKALRAPGST